MIQSAGMRDRIASIEWEASALGPRGTWPAELEMLLDVILRSAQPMFLAWGEDRIWFYNDAFVLILGNKHPAALGQPSAKVWAEAWDDLEPMFDRDFSGEPIYMDDIALKLDRHGNLSEARFAFSYNPVNRKDDGDVFAGLFGVCIETTDRHMAERRERSAQERQRRLFEQAPGFIIIMRGPDHIIEFVNDAHKAVFNSDDWVGKTIREAFPSIEGQGYFEQLDEVLRTGRSFEHQAAPVHYRRGPQSPEELRYLTFIYAPLHADDGSVSGVFCEGFDVTEAALSEARGRALVALSDRIRDIDDPDELAFAAAEILGRSIGVSRAGYGTINKREETITIERDWNAEGIRTLAGTLHFRDYGSYIDELKQGITVVCENAETDSRTAGTAEALKAISAQAFVNMPVTEQGNFVALLYLNHANARGWSDGEIALIREVADRTRTVVERRRAEQALRVNEARLQFLDRLAVAISTADNADAVLAVTTRMVATHLGISNCAYADMDEDEDGFTIRGDWAAPGSPSIVGHYSLADFGELAVRNLSAGKPLVVNDNLKELAPHEAKTFQDIGIAATICMPLVKEGRLTALMAIHDKIPHRWSDEELALIREVTERSWAHVERVRSQAELRSTADALAQLNATLEQRVQERTGELMAAEEALRQSQKMEAVGQLTGGLAHDFNNILAGIMGSLDLMQTRLAQGRISEIDRYLTGAQGAGKRAANLTQRLLAFSRRQTLDPRAADLNKLIAGILDLVNRSVGPTIEVEAVAAAGLWTTFVDVGQLENALLNLCINARDAMPDGGKLTIQSGDRWLDERAAKQRGLSSGQYVSLCVSDTGAGMPPDVIARGDAEHGEEVPELTEAPRASGYRTVLVVDDEPLVRMVAVEILEELGYRVLEAFDGPTAMAILQGREKVDLLVTDVGLPNGMNGRQLADAARSLRQVLQVLFITGYAENAVLNHGHLDQGMHVMTKPFPAEQFARRLKELVGG